MKKIAKIGLWLILLLFIITACATTKVNNIVRSQRSIGNIGTPMMIKVESGFAPSKQGTILKKTVSDELQKNGFKIEQSSDIVLNVEIEDFQIPSSASR
ncbi:MAG: hypothetical protein M1147_05685 [Nitrospirae bacterium]|nr:hypothetical protein [Nitrospirota bacterium]MCL5977609.1 hypothetical protein [Nitrospirota bacterium]